MQAIARVAATIGMDPMDLLPEERRGDRPKGLSGEGFCQLRPEGASRSVRRDSGWDQKYGKLAPYHGIGVAGRDGVWRQGAFKHDTSAALVTGR